MAAETMEEKCLSSKWVSKAEKVPDARENLELDGFWGRIDSPRSLEVGVRFWGGREGEIQRDVVAVTAMRVPQRSPFKNFSAAVRRALTDGPQLLAPSGSISTLLLKRQLPRHLPASD